MSRILSLFFMVILTAGCEDQAPAELVQTNVQIVSAMKNVMWKGELGSSIDLDTIQNKEGLFGLGPVAYLQGELLINNGQAYISRVVSDSAMVVEKSFEVSAPFFVYAYATNWHQVNLPDTVKDIKGLEAFILEQSSAYDGPFPFRLKGRVKEADIHIQNLPEGSMVRSPKEAHQGQVNYKLQNEDVEVVGFFSTQHQGVFTHHDSFLHMHLITMDESKMGHLDAVVLDKMRILFPSYK